VVCVVALVLVLGAHLPVAAQGKDPFRPPPGAGAPAAPAPAPGSAVDPNPADPVAPGDGLARTGQDVAAALGLGMLLLAVGVALRLTERAMSPAVR
jgi:hypothetical protein